jgi:hypothetical protein
MTAKQNHSYFTFGIVALGILLSSLSTRSLADDSEERAAAPVIKSESPLDADQNKRSSTFSVHYFGIYFGPVLSPSTEAGNPQPLLDTRNFITLNSTINEDTVFGVTAGWSWQGIPAENASLRDPFLKLGKSNILRGESFSWYGDIRVHMPVTTASRERDLWVGVQSFHFLSIEKPGAFGANLSLSGRYNQFGGQGVGDQWELYAAPGAFWNLIPRLALNLLLEWGAGQPFGGNSRILLSNGLDLEPGLSLRLSDGLLINPYVNIPIDQTAWEINGGTSLGMTVSWQWL